MMEYYKTDHGNLIAEATTPREAIVSELLALKQGVHVLLVVCQKGYCTVQYRNTGQGIVL